ncbi:MAG: GAF domain-containing protein [Chloroflexia bacterium]|nr:GAF domain-containing protein [Chloroflexia bacterium]
MASRIGESTAEQVQKLGQTMDRLSLRAFYWLRLEGEARSLSDNLGRRIAECLDALLEGLSREDLVPMARFLVQEQQRVLGLPPTEQIMQPIALLDACERAIEEALETSYRNGQRPQPALNQLRSLAHQSRRYWLQVCTSPLPAPTGRDVANLLSSLGQALDSASDLDELVDQLFAGLGQIIPHEDGQLLLWGPRQEEPIFRCANSQLFVSHGSAIDSYSNWVAFQRTPLLVPHLDADPDQADRPAFQSYLGVPLLQGEHLVGTLSLASTEAEAFAQADLELLMALAPLLSAAIQRVVPEVGPLEELQRRLEEQNIILAFGREMSAALEEGRIYSLLLYKALELSDSDAGAVLTVDHEREEYTIQALSGYATDLSAEDTLINSNTLSWNVGVVGKVARTGRPLLVSNIQDAEEYFAVRPETRAQLSVPIHWRGETFGVLNLESNHLNAYTEEHLQICQTLTEHAGVAIATARLYQEVLERREWLSSLVANLPEGIMVTDEELRVILSNPASAHFFRLEQPVPNGARLEEYLLSRLRPFLQDPQSLSNFLQRTQDLDQGLTEGWVEFKESFGRLWLVGTPLWGEGGRLSGRIILIRDASQNEDSEREKLGFVSVISHELRSPLTSILGYSELLLSRDFARERQQQFMEIIFNQAEHLSQLVDDLLSLSRLSRGRMRMNWTMASFYQLAASLATQLTGQMTDRHSLLMDVAEELPAFYLDRDKVRAVLNNLINNAVKYSPEGGEIVLRAELIPEDYSGPPLRASTPAPFLLVSVRDQGMGIPPEALPHIFDRFYRVDNSSTRKIGGTGLGLTLAKAMIELHEGEIWVESKLEEGSTFYFSLPLRQRPPKAQQEALEAEPGFVEDAAHV